MTLYTTFYYPLPSLTMLLYFIILTAVGYDTSSFLMVRQWNLQKKQIS